MIRAISQSVRSTVASVSQPVLTFRRRRMTPSARCGHRPRLISVIVLAALIAAGCGQSSGAPETSLTEQQAQEIFDWASGTGPGALIQGRIGVQAIDMEMFEESFVWTRQQCDDMIDLYFPDELADAPPLWQDAFIADREAELPRFERCDPVADLQDDSIEPWNPTVELALLCEARLLLSQTNPDVSPCPPSEDS